MRYIPHAWCLVGAVNKACGHIFPSFIQFLLLFTCHTQNTLVKWEKIVFSSFKSKIDSIKYFWLFRMRWLRYAEVCRVRRTVKMKLSRISKTRNEKKLIDIELPIKIGCRTFLWLEIAPMVRDTKTEWFNRRHQQQQITQHESRS